MGDKKRTINDEKLSCFQKEDLKLFHTGKMSHVFPKSRNISHVEKIPHIIIRLFAKDENGRFLVQKRSELKKVHTGRWTDSASGHVIYQPNFSYETIEDTVHKELKEEMGCNLLACRFYEFFLDEIGENEYELNYIFLGIVDTTLTLDNEEVDKESGFLAAAELEKRLSKEKINGHKAWVGVSKKYWQLILEKEMEYLFDQMTSQIKNGYDPSDPPKQPKGTGLIIGRFQPVHKGHVKLIEESLKFVKKLKIGVGSSQFSDVPENPFSFDERELMLNLSLSNTDLHPDDYEIIPIPDEFNLEKWLDNVLKIAADFDVVITNNLWIGRLFQLRGKQMLYGLKFNFEEYNGSYIRNMIYGKEPDWIGLVPKSVFKLIGQHATLKRLKKIGRKRV